MYPPPGIHVVRHFAGAPRLPRQTTGRRVSGRTHCVAEGYDMSSGRIIGAKPAYKAAGWVVSVVAVALAAPVGRGQVVAHWSFDSQAGGTYADQTGNHNATIVTNGTGAISSG